MKITKAMNLWIEAGKMSGWGEVRYQIDLADWIAEFFTKAELTAGRVEIQLRKGRPAISRPLTCRRAGDVDCTSRRLGLPTEVRGGPPYSGRVIHLQRLHQKGKKTYRLRVEDLGSQAAHLWRAKSVHILPIRHPMGREIGYW